MGYHEWYGIFIRFGQGRAGPHTHLDEHVSKGLPSALTKGSAGRRNSHLVKVVNDNIQINQTGNLNGREISGTHREAIIGLTFSCPLRCLSNVISLKQRLARIALSNTRVSILMAMVSPLSESCAEMTNPYAPWPNSRNPDHRFSRWNTWLNKMCDW
jgi:hypothetical protein